MMKTSFLVKSTKLCSMNNNINAIFKTINQKFFLTNICRLDYNNNNNKDYGLQISRIPKLKVNHFLDNKINKVSVKNFFGKNDNQNQVTISKSKFVDGSFIVANSKMKKISLGFYAGTVTSLFILTGYKFISSILHFRVVRTFLWGVSFLITLRIFSTFIKNTSVFILEIKLLEDGKRTQIKTISTNFIVDISSFRELNEQEKLYYSKNYISKGMLFYPIVINNEIYCLHAKSDIQSKEVLTAIRKGEYIKIVDDNDSNSDNDDQNRTNDETEKGFKSFKSSSQKEKIIDI